MPDPNYIIKNIKGEWKHGKEKSYFLYFIVLVSAFLFLGNIQTVPAGVEPSPWQPQINQLHSIELNIAAIDKRIGKLSDKLSNSTISPEGAADQLWSMAEKLGVLDARLADVFRELPPYNSDYIGKDEVIAALNGISSDAESIRDVADRMGVEPTPWQPAASAVMNNANNIISRINEYMRYISY